MLLQGTSADRASQHCQKLLRQGREVVVDRCNIRADDRSFYSRLQQQSSAIFVASCTLHLAAHVCAARALQKDSIQDHEQVLARICRCVPSRALSRFSGLFLCRHAASAGHTKAIQLALQRLGVCYGLDLQLLGFQLPWLLKEQCNKAQRAPAAIAIINGSYACRQQEEYQPVLQGPEGFAIVYDMHRQADIDAFVAQMGPASPAYATRNTEQPSLPQGPRRPQAAASHALQVSHAAAASQPGPSIGRQHWQQQPVNSADHDVNVSFQWADYSAPQQVHAQAQRRNWWDQAGSSIQPSDSPRSAATHQSVGRLQTSQAVPVQPPSMQHISVRPQMHHPAELFQKPSKSLADSHPDSHCQSAPHALPSSTCSAIQAASQPAAIAIVTAMQQHPPLLQVLPTRHPFGGGPLLPSACPGSPGTASSPAPAASRQHSNLQLLQTASSPSSQPSPASKKAKHKKQQAGSVAIPAASANAHSGGDGARAPSCAAEIAAASRLPVNNIVPGPQGIDGSQWQQFTHTFQPPRLPIDEMDPRPIILFDLNGTLTQHTAVRNSTGNTMLRPGIEHLVKLQVKCSGFADTPHMHLHAYIPRVHHTPDGQTYFMSAQSVAVHIASFRLLHPDLVISSQPAVHICIPASSSTTARTHALIKYHRAHAGSLPAGHLLLSLAAHSSHGHPHAAGSSW